MPPGVDHGKPLVHVLRQRERQAPASAEIRHFEHVVHGGAVHVHRNATHVGRVNGRAVPTGETAGSPSHPAEFFPQRLRQPSADVDFQDRCFPGRDVDRANAAIPPGNAVCLGTVDRTVHGQGVLSQVLDCRFQSREPRQVPTPPRSLQRDAGPLRGVSGANQQRPVSLTDFRVGRDRCALGQGLREVRQHPWRDGWFAGKRNRLDEQQAGKHKHQRTSGPRGLPQGSVTIHPEKPDAKHPSPAAGGGGGRVGFRAVALGGR